MGQQKDECCRWLDPPGVTFGPMIECPHPCHEFISSSNGAGECGPADPFSGFFLEPVQCDGLTTSGNHCQCHEHPRKDSPGGGRGVSHGHPPLELQAFKLTTTKADVVKMINETLESIRKHEVTFNAAKFTVFADMISDELVDTSKTFAQQDLGQTGQRPIFRKVK